MAAHPCLPCSRYFSTPLALGTHLRGKPHKRRCKKLEEEPYTIEESRRAVGLGTDSGTRGASGSGNAVGMKVDGGLGGGEGMEVEPTAV